LENIEPAGGGRELYTKGASGLMSSNHYGVHAALDSKMLRDQGAQNIHLDEIEFFK
jgi:hypothetical protein